MFEDEGVASSNPLSPLRGSTVFVIASPHGSRRGLLLYRRLCRRGYCSTRHLALATRHCSSSLRARPVQNLDDLRLAVLLREGEGRAAVFIFGVHVRAVL